MNCVEESGGVKRCSKCVAAEYICAESCCESGSTCTAGVCSAVYGAPKQSCSAGLFCGKEGADSCCESLAVTGGTFPQGSTASDTTAFSDEKPERASTVSSFALDKYEVTVGRFRKFVEEWQGKFPPPPKPGAGAHPKIADSGWRSAWDKRLPASREEWEVRLVCDQVASTWKISAGAKDSLPINCVNWYEAFAFCAWDGGRLPTEAEWEYAAAGGAENREYPWVPELGGPTSTLAVYNCLFGSYGSGATCFPDDIAEVGSLPAGAGLWGHRDLAGNTWEWVLDGYDEYPSVATKDWANVEVTPVRVQRGGSWGSFGIYLRAAGRANNPPSYRGQVFGFRCARAL